MCVGGVSVNFKVFYAFFWPISEVVNFLWLWNEMHIFSYFYDKRLISF